MPAVHIKSDVYDLINKLCVDITIKTRETVKQGSLINALLNDNVTQLTTSEIIEIYKSDIKKN